MRTFALLLLPALSLLTLGAHYLRRFELVPVAACVALVALLAVRRWWVARAAQAALLFATFVWLRTLFEMLPARRASGEPVGRLVVILGSVALVALVSALMLELPALRRRYRGPRSEPAA